MESEPDSEQWPDIWPEPDIQYIPNYYTVHTLSLFTMATIFTSFYGTMLPRPGRLAFYLKCLRQILGVCWHQHVTNSEILSDAGVGSLAEQIARQRTAAFGHIARLADNVPACLVLRCQIDTSLGRPPSNT